MFGFVGSRVCVFWGLWVCGWWGCSLWVCWFVGLYVTVYVCVCAFVCCVCVCVCLCLCVRYTFETLRLGCRNERLCDAKTKLHVDSLGWAELLYLFLPAPSIPHAPFFFPNICCLVHFMMMTISFKNLRFLR